MIAYTLTHTHNLYVKPSCESTWELHTGTAEQKPSPEPLREPLGTEAGFEAGTASGTAGNRYAGQVVPGSPPYRGEPDQAPLRGSRVATPHPVAARLPGGVR